MPIPRERENIKEVVEVQYLRVMCSDSLIVQGVPHWKIHILILILSTVAAGKK